MSNATLPAVAGTPQQPTQVAVRREIRVVEDDGLLANLMDTARFEHLQRIANVMSASSLLPDHLCLDRTKKQLPDSVVAANCFRVTNQALRWGFDPFAIVDETYVVGGKLGYQGKLVAAVVNSRAKLKSRLNYTFDGTGDNLTVTVSGTFEGETESRTITLRLGDARTSNGMWTKDPEQKLIYSGVVKWARRHCPEVVLGVLTDDDLDRMSSNAVPVNANDKLTAKINQLNGSPTPDGDNKPQGEEPNTSDTGYNHPDRTNDSDASQSKTDVPSNPDEGSSPSLILTHALFTERAEALAQEQGVDVEVFDTAMARISKELPDKSSDAPEAQAKRRDVLAQIANKTFAWTLKRAGK